MLICFNTVYTYSLLETHCPCWQIISFVRVSACADAIQMKPQGLKILILYSKNSKSKSYKFTQMEKLATFPTLHIPTWVTEVRIHTPTLYVLIVNSLYIVYTLYNEFTNNVLLTPPAIRP